MRQLRNRIGSALLVVAVALGVPVGAQGPQQQPLTMRQLAPDVWVGLEGGGGNSTIIIGRTSVIVVDAKTNEATAKALLAEIARITPKPVTTLIQTHSDGDHANGVIAFPAGVRVIAHEGNKREQEAALAAGGRGAPPPDRLPSQVVTAQREVLTIDGVRLELHHFSRAHTSGDLAVFLPDQRIVATGDVIMGNMADDNPLIHPEKSGTTEGWLTFVEGMIALNVDTYVPGHGDVQTRADLQRKLKATADRRAAIATAVRAGRTLDEVKAAFPDPMPAARAGGPAPGAAPGGRGADAPGGAAPAAAQGAAAGRGGARGGGPVRVSFAEMVYNEVIARR